MGGDRGRNGGAGDGGGMNFLYYILKGNDFLCLLILLISVLVF